MASRHPPPLDLAARAAVARIAEGHLEDAAEALNRIRNPRDRAALHNFRVAVRRLRSLLRAYRPWLGRAAGKKVRRRLRELTRVTGAGRDAEVQIEWLEAQRRYLDQRERSGLNWLLRRLRDQKRESYRAARKQLRGDFGHAAKMLGERLDAGDEPGPKRYREAFSELLQQQVSDFSRRLAVIAGADDEEAAHQARIRAKRLRYLVEPLRRELPEAHAAVRQLKRLLDLMGKLHDRHLLESDLYAAVEEAATEKARRLHALALAGDQATLARERRRDERLGLVALAARARVERDGLFAELQRGWLRDRSREIMAPLAALCPIIVPAADREIERKYLLKALPPRAGALPAQEIEQGWLPGERLRERLRRVKGPDGERYFRTVKLGAGMQRLEIEEETTAELFDALWPHTEGCRVRKRRYRVAEGALTWEIDQFVDRDLVLAEVELPDTTIAVEPPQWLRRYAVREVTADPAYLNLNLAR